MGVMGTGPMRGIHVSEDVDVLNIQNAIAKWQRNTAGAAESYKAGIQGVTENPMALAAAQADKAARNYQEALMSGRWAQKLMSVPFDQWKQNASVGGSQRLASGVTKGLPKVTKHFQEWGQTYEQAKQAARAIPKDGKAGSMARVAAVYDIMRAKAGKPF